MSQEPKFKIELINAIAMYRKQGRSDKWIKARLDGLQIRNQFTDTLKQHGIVKPGHYAACTDAINKPILGVLIPLRD